MDFIYSGIGWLLSLFNSWTGNYIIALLFFAVFAKVILLPLDIKQQKNSIKQAKLRPKEMAIRNKYKGRTDRATQMKMQQEIQDLYQREGYSMFGGCLPLLIQFPIIIILYGVIRQPISYIMEGYSADVITAMKDALNSINGVESFNTSDQISMIAAIRGLSEDGAAAFTSAIQAVSADFDLTAFEASLPNFDVFGFNVGYSPDQYREAVAGGNFFNMLLLIPAMNFIMQFAFTKIMKKFQPQPMVDDPSQRASMNIMELTLPLMTVFFAYNMSGAIGIYWIFQNIISMCERFIIAKAMPLPVYTEEEIKEIQKAMKNAPARNAERPERPERKDGEKPRSLHRIDEDDDDTTPVITKPKQAPSESEKKNAAIAEKVIGDAPALKDESDKYNKKNK